MSKSDIELILGLIYHGDFSDLDILKPQVNSSIIPSLLLTYRYLDEDWSAKARCIYLLEGYQELGVRNAALDFLTAPIEEEDETRAYAKSIAIGLVDEQYQKGSTYFHNRQQLFNDVDKVLIANGKPPIQSVTDDEEDAIRPKKKLLYDVSKHPNQNLMNGAWTNDLILMNAAVRDGAHIDTKIGSGNKIGCTCLIIACMFKNYEAAFFLLEKGADVKRKRSDEHHPNPEKGQTALWWAANHGHLGLCTALLQMGAEVDMSDMHGSTPLHQAAEAGHLEIVQLLLTHGANVHAQIYDGRKPIHLATSKGKTKVVKRLMKARNNAEEPLLTGFTLLHLAIDHGHSSMVNLLIRNGADVNAQHKGLGIYKSYKGWTPLIFAVHRGRVAITKKLLKEGADLQYLLQIPEARNADGCTQKTVYDFINGKYAKSMKAILDGHKR